MSTDLLNVAVVIDADYRIHESVVRLLRARIEAAVLDISEDYSTIDFVVKVAYQ